MQSPDSMQELMSCDDAAISGQTYKFHIGTQVQRRGRGGSCGIMIAAPVTLLTLCDAYSDMEPNAHDHRATARRAAACGAEHDAAHAALYSRSDCGGQPSLRVRLLVPPLPCSAPRQCSPAV